MTFLRTNFRLMAFIALLFTIGLACSTVTGSSPTQTPVPTQTPQPTLPPEPSNTPPVPSPAATEESTQPPEPTTPPDSGSGLLGDQLITGSESVFEFYMPEGWEITAEDEASLWIEPDDFSGAIYLEVTNTDIALDGASFERFIAAREDGDFSSFENYSEEYSFYESEDGFAVVEKTLDYEGVPQYITTYYEQHDNVIFMMDFWADDDALGDYQEMFDEFYLNAFSNQEQASTLEPYLFVYDFYGPNDLFFIEVPTGWTYEQTTADLTMVDTFFSPDEHAVIQSIAYDDGEEILEDEASVFALDLLTNFYAEDIDITDEEVQADGSVRLTWNSPSSAFSGNTFYETRGTTFLLFTIMWDDEYEDVYFPILDYTVTSYDVP